MEIINYFAAGVVFLLLLVQVFNADFFRKNPRDFFVVSVGIIILGCALLSYFQYRAWNENELSRLLLPPHQGMGYFIKYAFFRFWAPYLFSLVLALLFFFGARRYNNLRGNSLFYEEEYTIGALALLFSGYPGAVFFLLVFAVLFFLATLRSFLKRGKKSRVSTRFFWLPVAIFVILIQQVLVTTSWWSLLKV